MTVRGNFWVPRGVFKMGGSWFCIRFRVFEVLG